MIEKLKNCPNCAGILDEAGRCKYCGSKVYDFLTLDFGGEKVLETLDVIIVDGWIVEEGDPK